MFRKKIAEVQMTGGRVTRIEKIKKHYHIQYGVHSQKVQPEQTSFERQVEQYLRISTTSIY